MIPEKVGLARSEFFPRQHKVWVGQLLDLKFESLGQYFAAVVEYTKSCLVESSGPLHLAATASRTDKELRLVDIQGRNAVFSKKLPVRVPDRYDLFIAFPETNCTDVGNQLIRSRIGRLPTQRAALNAVHRRYGARETEVHDLSFLIPKRVGDQP